MQEIYKRRSYHDGFDSSRKISEEDILEILKAGMNAPSAHDAKSWEFVVVNDSDKLESLSKLNPWVRACASASHVVLICDKPSDSAEINTGIAAQNIALAAAGLEVGSLMMGIYPDDEAQTKIRDLVNLPADYSAILMIALGYPTETLPLNNHFFEDKIHWNEYYKYSATSHDIIV